MFRVAVVSKFFGGLLTSCENLSIGLAFSSDKESFRMHLQDGGIPVNFKTKRCDYKIYFFLTQALPLKKCANKFHC